MTESINDIQGLTAASVDLRASRTRMGKLRAGLSFRRMLFRLHWLMGITIGLVLAFMGMTGAIMGFEDEIMQALSPQAHVAISAPAPLPPDTLLDIVRLQLPKERITALQIEADPDRAYTVTVLRRPADGARNPRIFVNPYDGKLLGEATGADFFGRVRSLHRYLTASGASNELGRHITGIAAFGVIFFAISGLYLRWPKRSLDWRVWFRLDFSMRGRAFYRALHSVIGSWLAIVYIISALSGLWWSYDWYREVVTTLLSSHAQVERPRKEKTAAVPQAAEPAKLAAAVGIDRVLATVRQDYGARLSNVLIVLPQPGKPARARVLTTEARHDRALDDLQIDPASGEVTKRNLYADLKPGEWIMANMDPIHTGIAFGPAWRAIVVLAALGLPMFAATGLLLYADRRRKGTIAMQSSSTAITLNAAASPGPLIIYASQNGAAEMLARQAAGDFHRAGKAAQTISIAEVDLERLQAEYVILFITSTYGDGHAPDTARRFERRFMTLSASLKGLNYGMLALGDCRHADFCAFGKRLDFWLQENGATPIFDRIDVDAHNAAALSSWQQRLAVMGAVRSATESARKNFHPWVLKSRDCLNPGSVGLPAYRIQLTAVDGASSWQPGDIAEILAGTDADIAPVREYSIASIPADGAITLIVRQALSADGSLGLGSGWLTALAGEGETVHLRIRKNSNFHTPDINRPMILIGNGTGIAGLHAHLRHRAGHMPTENWLFFGERNQATDFLMREELSRLETEGALQKISTAFSRDQTQRIYVQHRISQQADELRRWVQRGAAIYVCGSSDTMAPAVDKALREAIGETVIEDLIRQGLYRRDIY